MEKVKNYLRLVRVKATVALVALLMPVLMFAEGTAESLDTTQAVNAATTIKTGFKSLVTSVAPLIVDIVVVALGIIAVLWVVRLCMRAWRTRG